MDPRTTLDNWQFQAAMRILEREQTAFLPTDSELKRNRLFNRTVYLLVALYAALLVLKDREWFLSQLVESNSYLYALMGLALVAVVAAGLNLPLFAKLWRLERLRDRLGLRQHLTPLIAVRRGLLARIVGALWSFLLLLFALLCLALLAVMIGKWSTAIEKLGVRDSILLAVSFAGAAFSLLFQPLVERARNRLEIVQGLWGALAERESEVGSGESAVELPSDQYRSITEVESSQILLERDQSVRAARARKRGVKGLAVRQTPEAIRSRSQLEPEIALKVGDRILALSDEPRPEEAVRDPESGVYSVEVPGTSLRVCYEIDPSGRVVRIVALDGGGSS